MRVIAGQYSFMVLPQFYTNGPRVIKSQRTSPAPFAEKGPYPKIYVTNELANSPGSVPPRAESLSEQSALMWVPAMQENSLFTLSWRVHQAVLGSVLRGSKLAG